MVRITDFRSVHSGSNPGPMTSPTLIVQVVKDSTSSSSNTGDYVRGEGPNSPCIHTAKMFVLNKEVEPKGITR